MHHIQAIGQHICFSMHLLLDASDDTVVNSGMQIIKPAVADAAGQAEYAADRITGEAIMPLAQAVADQV